MEFFKDDLDWDYTAKKRFRVIVVGAGIAGLTVAIGKLLGNTLKRLGHSVILLEQVSQISEVGAGMQLAPNASRILGRLGLLEKVLDHANIIESNAIRRWKDNAELGTAPLMPQIGKRHNAPLSVIHRGDFQHILITAAYDMKIDVRLNHRVVRIDPSFSARVQCSSGEWIDGDVVIAADGIKSSLRCQMASVGGVKDRSSPTGDAAYRVLIPREKLKDDPHTLKLLDSNVGMRWIGPQGHIMAYPIKNNQVYNMVLVHPAKPNTGKEEPWMDKGDKQEMLAFYKGWNQVVRDLLTYVPEGQINEWTLNSHSPLPCWVENACALIGDSCHPMLPYVAQGAAQAIEDAAVLTITLSLADDVPTALRVYEKIRKARGEAIQASAASTRQALHLPDGAEQKKRDEAIGGAGPNPDLWADTDWQDFMWGVDVMKDALTNWNQYIAGIQDPHADNMKYAVH